LLAPQQGLPERQRLALPVQQQARLLVSVP
jgi:hypothetical protein